MNQALLTASVPQGHLGSPLAIHCRATLTTRVFWVLVLKLLHAKNHRWRRRAA
jgi:hypothetical protein